MLIFSLFLVNFVNANYCEYVDKEYVVKDKTIVITGGAQGIGYAIADNFLHEGAKLIIILDINVPKGTQAVENLNAKYGDNKATFIKCDVTKDLKEVSSRIIVEFTYIDVFVNNAGFVKENCVKKTIATIITATIEWSLVFRDHMRKDKGGRGGTIINIASITGHSIDPFIVVYKSAKYAVIGFSKSLGHEYNYKNTGVRVVVICPGVTDTQLWRRAVFWKEQRETALNVLKNVPHQKADAVGRGTVQVYRQAKTGSAWDIDGGKPPTKAPISTNITLSEIEYVDNE